MKSALWAIVFSIIGGVLGAFLALGFGASVGVTSGLVQGAQVGTCLAVQTARTQGLIETEGQADQLIADTTETIRSKARDLPTQADTTWVTDEAGCAELIAKLGSSPSLPQ